MNNIDRFLGTYQGSGSWHDSVGGSARYAIRQTNAATENGFEVAFNHDFDDGTVVDARFTMTWIATNIFRVDAAGAPIGHGYVIDDVCHYHMKAGDRFIEASYRVTANGLHVLGSSSTNADGNYIYWTEGLLRA